MSRPTFDPQTGQSRPAVPAAVRVPRQDTARFPTFPPPGVAVRPRSRWWRWLVPVLVFLVLLGPVLELALIGAIYVQARTEQARPVDAIVVLGTAQYNGRPSPTFQARLDRALALYRQGLAATIIVTGGSQPGDAYTEAESGQMFLTDAGVPSGAIVLENEGRDSWQSMNGVAGILAARHLGSILIVSDGFHLLRLKMMARELGITAYSTASDSPIRGGEEFGYVVREALAITAFVLGQR